MRNEQKLTVKLSSSHLPALSIEVQSLKEASTTCKAYIEKHDLTGEDFGFGKVFEDSNQIAKISYNGRIWDMSNKEILISKEDS